MEHWRFTSEAESSAGRWSSGKGHLFMTELSVKKIYKTTAVAFSNSFLTPQATSCLSILTMIRVFTSIFAFTLALTGATAKFPTIVYKFNPTDAAGVGGSITVQYTASTVANIDAKLDFSHVDKKKIASLDASCKTHSVKSYNWHLHTGWMSSKSSASFKECSKMMTGNHFDPDKACGPASQHIAQPDCKKKSESYECTPFKYKSDQKSCEAGDLSGKFGAFLPGSDHKVSAKWTDHHFMPLSETSKHKLSIVLHAVCGKESPRFACAMGSKQN